MFKREEYKARLADVGLSEEQTRKLRAVLDEMMTHATRSANRVLNAQPPRTAGDLRFVQFMEGKSSGINAVDRFLRGDMDAHDEFEE